MNLLSAASDAITRGTPIAFLLAFLFGVASSFGPCSIARFGMLSNVNRAGVGRRTALFVAGTIAMYVAFALAARWLLLIRIAQTEIVTLGAVGFAVAALVLFVRSATARDCDHDHSVMPAADSSGLRGDVGLFGLGALSACNLNPCCAPFLFMALAITAQLRAPLFAVALMVAFGAGHAVPLLAFNRAAANVVEKVSHSRFGQIVPLVGVAFMLWLAIFYVVQV